jgi:uncharacterized protein HemX
MNRTRSTACAALCFLLSSLLPPVAYSQDFSSIDNDLLQLQNLIDDTLLNTREQEKLLEDLRQTLAGSGTLIGNYETIIAVREQSLRDLQTRLAEMSETYRTQASLFVARV